MRWTWSYNWFCGIMYGPIPIGLILVIVAYVGYHSATSNGPTDRSRNGDASDVAMGSPMTPIPARPLVSGPIRSPSQRNAAVGADDRSTVEEDLNSIHKELEERRKKRAEEEDARERERKGPDPSDPAYLDKLAGRTLSENILYKSEAIEALLKADPATASPETKKKVARAFKTLAEDEHSYEMEKAVRGLVKWAGVYSVPVLLKMLNNDKFGDETPVIKALAELQDSRAVPTLVKMLNDSRGSHNDELIIKTLVEFKDPARPPH